MTREPSLEIDRAINVDKLVVDVGRSTVKASETLFEVDA